VQPVKGVKMRESYRIGVVGSGFIAKGFVTALDKHQGLNISKVLTRTNIEDRTDFPRQELLTNSLDELIYSSDLIVECSGDVIHATYAVDKIMKASLPVVTMDADLQVTTGSWLARRGFITEAEGDQPGCLASLKKNVVQMGFNPVVYGNIKGFLNHTPGMEDMEYWAQKQDYRIDKVVSYTDGTKLQIEQTLVANGLGAGIAQSGMLGIASEDVNTGALALAEQAKPLGYPISDYILSPKSPAGVFIVAEHDERQKVPLRNFKLGEGPYYVLLQNFHLCHLEIAKTVRNVLSGDGILLTNGENPSISVAAVAKRSLTAGDLIARGTGGFDTRGIAVRIEENPDHVPIGLLVDAVVTRDIEPGQQVTFGDVELPESLALHAWRETVRRPANPRSLSDLQPVVALD